MMEFSLENTPVDPKFHQEVFSLVDKIQKKETRSPIEKVLWEEHAGLSEKLNVAEIQESATVRNVLKTRLLTPLLFTEEGTLDLQKVQEAIRCLKQSLYRLGPHGALDSPRNLHLLEVLQLIDQKPEAQKAIHSITAPYQNKVADQLIRETLQLPADIPIKDLHARQACLSAWLCFLRQNVGSCFATAPAILIHSEQPFQMLNDFQELLSTGKLRRVFGGVEFSVPLSPSWGAGDSKKIVDLMQDSLYQSPGLIRALCAAQVISSDSSIEEQEQALLHLIRKLRPFLPRYSNVEEIIKAIILDQCGLSSKDLEEAQLKEKSSQASPLMPPSHPLGKHKKIALFEHRFQTALTEFRLLADNPLLKSWEFTLASFSESKADFTRWNLYASLGLRPEQPGGIGECLRNYLQEKVDECNQRAQEMQEDYERAYARLKYIEARVQNASTEKEIEWMRAEYQSSRNEFYTLEEIRNDYVKKAKRFAHLFNHLIDEYDDLFLKYFQEIYDANLQEVTSGSYDDSPAGFRLVYKYGRSHTSQWTYIEDQHQFIDALAQFFSNTEIEISSLEGFQGLETDLSHIVSHLIQHIRSMKFLETAFDRMAQAHHTPPIKDPLEHLDQIDKKPWVYTSGGTMNNLVSAYWGRDTKPTDFERWVENPMELFVFFVDTVKQIPEKQLELFKKFPSKRLLIHSPTHAFTLLPGAEHFMKAWSENAFTYTWIRDHLVRPRKEFVETLILEEEMIEALLGYMAKQLPPDLRPSLLQTAKQIHGRHTPMEVRRELVKLLPKISPEWIDSALYENLPLFPLSQYRERFEYLVRECREISIPLQEQMIALYDAHPIPYTLDRYAPIHQLIESVKAFYCLATRKTSDSLDLHAVIYAAAQRLGYVFPEPIFVADSNWNRDFFAFVVNPGTGELDFWRVSPLSESGGPVTGWRQWLDGTRQQPKWGIYANPVEYTSRDSLFV